MVKILLQKDTFAGLQPKRMLEIRPSKQMGHRVLHPDKPFNKSSRTTAEIHAARSIEIGLGMDNGRRFR
jgi:hypothetical protein